ncbi:MAG: DNA translocase FtsK [bacterium]
MARSKRKQKQQGDKTKGTVRREVAGILLILFASLSIIALTAGREATVLRTMNDCYQFILGVWAMAVPVMIFILAGLALTGNRLLLRVILHGAVLLVFAAVFYHLVRAPVDVDFCVNESMLREGGGIIGAAIACNLLRSVGRVGSLLVISSVFLIYVRFALRISYIEIYRKTMQIAKTVLSFFQHRTNLIFNAVSSLTKHLVGLVKPHIRKSAKAKEVVQPSSGMELKLETPLIDEEEAVQEAAQPVIEQEEEEDEEEIEEPLMEEKLPVVEINTRKKPVRYTWKLPAPDDWLDPDDDEGDAAEDEAMRQRLEKTLESFQVPAKIVNVVKGASYARFEIELEPGTKVSQLISLGNDIALSLAADARTIRIEAPIPGKSAVGIEVPNKERLMVPMRKVYMTPVFQNAKSPLAFVLGQDIGGNPICADLIKMPHLLIAGSTNSGKSVCINSFITSIIARRYPEEIRFILIDMKRVELTPYDGIPHLLTPVIREVAEAASALRWVTAEMDKRYKIFAEMGARNIDVYNGMLGEQDEKMHRIVVVIDELADLMMVSSPNQYVEMYICRIAQLARATGIHMALATQRPDTKVITGTIKNNIPSRISFAVASQVDSRTVLDQKGAEALLGRGDMLFMPIDSNRLIRLQGVFVKDKELNRLIKFWKDQGVVEYPLKFDAGEGAEAGAGGQFMETEDEELYRKAVEIVLNTGQVSISMLQRKLRIGYNRSARLVEVMEDRGVVGASDGVKPREVLITAGAFDRGEY